MTTITEEIAAAEVSKAWFDLVEKDDRNSPEEYPDMCLITREELAGYITAALSKLPPAPEREVPEIIFWYKNYKGEAGMRRVRPLSFRHGTSEWHTEPQWLMLADDLENNKRREFAMRDMSGFVGPRVVLASPPAPDFSFTHDSLNRYLDKVREAWEAARSSPPDRNAVIEEWQPIETAPDDGQSFLAINSFGEQWICTRAAGRIIGVGQATCGMAAFVAEYATHWLPLPAPPAICALKTNPGNAA